MSLSLTGKGDASIEVDPRPDPKRYRGAAPAVVLVDPQFAHNVGNAVRACSCWGIDQLWWTGDSFTVAEGERLPREERMKGYRDVALFRHDRPLDCFDADATPVAVELRPGSEMLHHFEHPEKAVYVWRRRCTSSAPRTARFPRRSSPAATASSSSQPTTASTWRPR